MKGLVIYSDYITIENENHVRLFGRLENGQSFITINKFEPYLYIKKKDSKRISDKLKTESAGFKNFDGEEVIKIAFKNRTELTEFDKKFHHDFPTYEADIKPNYRFLIDKNIFGGIEIKGDYQASEKVDRIYKKPEIFPSEFKPNLKIVSIDTESEKETGKLISFCLIKQEAIIAK